MQMTSQAKFVVRNSDTVAHTIAKDTYITTTRSHTSVWKKHPKTKQQQQNQEHK